MKDFFKLCDEVEKCDTCHRMRNSARILSLASGSIDAKIMFIGEAPGRLGADDTGIPFHGDQAGNNFESLLNFVGINRADIFITNAVLCNPKDAHGNNATPDREEIRNCSNFLLKQIKLLNPPLIATLGATALKALSHLFPHDLTLKNNVRTKNQWFGRFLIPLYHPGQRAMVHRSMGNQRSDYQFLAEHLYRLGLKKRKIYGGTNKIASQLACFVISKLSPVSYFSLHKIFYLLEYNYMKKYNDRLTSCYFIRQKDGPYCTDIHLSKLRKSIPSMRVSNRNKSIYLNIENDMFGCGKIDQFSDESRNFIMKYLKEISGKTDAELKTKSYHTMPMKKILRMEKGYVNMYNAPIII